MRENPYQGINAHLNSSLQTRGTEDQPALWHSFHNFHIAQIVIGLNAQLPDHYIALDEQSLQTRGIDVGGFEEKSIKTPDVDIFQRKAVDVKGGAMTVLAPTWEAALIEVMQEPIRQPRAALIRELLPQRKVGRIVSRIELLSPSNKPSGSKYQTYVDKRTEAIQSEIPLIEIDYLHEQPPILSELPRYLKITGAYPYGIIVTDSRPDWYAGSVKVYGFSVAAPIAQFLLPLAAEESLIFDLNPVYQKTFVEGRWGDMLDYTDEPERFDTYSAEDQAKIRAVMATIPNKTT
ncbi:MAG: DUF4058 family protein [Chitinophagaceae bacterium]|nr:DUF4058 family protein [Anaerolineae bacterium]